MDPKPYDVWISIYNDELQNKWEEERPELRKISMIYCAFEIELDRLKASLNEEITEIKTKFKRKSFLQKCENFAGLAQSVPFDEIDMMNKENESPESMPLKQINLNKIESEDFFIESPDTSTFFEKPHSPPPSKLEVMPVSPVINKPRFTNNKKKTSPTILNPVVTQKVDKTPNLLNRKSNENKTPDDSNIMDCSIIEDTPEVNPTKRNKLSLRSKNTKKPKLTQCKQKTTLTQMFNLPKANKKEIDSNDPSMSINKIIDLINQSSDSETDAELDKSDETKDDLDLVVEPPKDFLRSFVENYDKVPEKKKEKSPEFIHVAPVRGKERKKLKGWSCKECEKYYEGLNLPPEELEKKKDECSRHRHKFKPRDETYKGFWDLTFGPTPRSLDS